MPLKLMYITNRPEVAEIAEKNGVDRIWIDLEKMGKEDRQRGKNTVISNHSIEDVRRMRTVLKTSELLVRVNPWHENSIEEIEAVIEAGADIIMLPMWKTVEEVNGFLSAVSGRCRTNLLLETKEAVLCIDEVLKNGGMDEIHIGLNDLHLSYQMTFMFELLANGMIDQLTEKIRDKGIPYGFGGIARLGAGDVPAELVIMEHYRLGSSMAILSRSFCDIFKIEDTREIERLFCTNMIKIRNFENEIASSASTEQLENNRKLVKTKVEQVVARKKNVCS